MKWGGLANADFIRGRSMLTVAGRGVKFAKILLTSYVNVPYWPMAVHKLRLPEWGCFVVDFSTYVDDGEWGFVEKQRPQIAHFGTVHIITVKLNQYDTGNSRLADQAL